MSIFVGGSPFVHARRSPARGLTDVGGRHAVGLDENVVALETGLRAKIAKLIGGVAAADPNVDGTWIA